jgi:hypothetical protein
MNVRITGRDSSGRKAPWTARPALRPVSCGGPLVLPGPVPTHDPYCRSTCCQAAHRVRPCGARTVPFRAPRIP